MPPGAQAAVQDYTLVLDLNPDNVNALIQRADAQCVLDEHQVRASFSCVRRQRDWHASERLCFRRHYLRRVQTFVTGQLWRKVDVNQVAHRLQA